MSLIFIVFSDNDAEKKICKSINMYQNQKQFPDPMNIDKKGDFR